MTLMRVTGLLLVESGHGPHWRTLVTSQRHQGTAPRYYHMPPPVAGSRTSDNIHWIRITCRIRRSVAQLRSLSHEISAGADAPPGSGRLSRSKYAGPVSPGIRH